ncbi:MAG TPA: two-component regulator propeller domain-containing protein [Puia sp.]|nr:two-component regulator propeller domain-containing protein [Puia sp.]
MRCKILVILLCWWPFCRQYGQSGEYVFSHLDFTGGLSNNHITSIYKDKRGFMWFGTIAGLNRYDGYQFRTFRYDPRDTNSIADNYIEQIFEGPGGKLWVESRAGRFNIYDFAADRFSRNYPAYLNGIGLPSSWLLNIVRDKEDYWFIYRDSGVYHLMPDGKIISFRNNPADAHSISSSTICGARTDGGGNCWIIHQNGLLEKIDGRRNTLLFSTASLQPSLGDNLSLCKIFIDKENDLWFYSNGVAKGICYYSPSTGEIRHLSQETAGGRLSSNVVYDILQDDKGAIWLATDHGGVNIVEKRDFSVKIINHIEDDDKSLADNSINTMLRDYTGTIWLGTFKNGISYFHEDRIQFPQYRHQPSNKASLNYDDISSFVEDPAGNIWIGANGGGLIYFDRKRNSFRQYLHDPRQPNSLSNNIIVSMLMDRSHRLWIGTYFGGLDCYDGKTFTHYRHNEKIASSLADDRVMCVYEDSGNRIWVGMLAGGMDRLDPGKKEFYHYTSSIPNSIVNNYVSSITEDSQQNLWVATGYGIDVLEKSTGRFVHYSSEVNRLGSNNVTILLRDSRQRMWAGTREGLNLFDPEKKVFQSFTTDNGLPDNTIRSIVEDRRHDIWVSTLNGISKLSGDGTVLHDSLLLTCTNFHEPDGLQGREFNEKSGFTARDGMIFFGGPNGFNLFESSNIIRRKSIYPVVLTDLQLFNKSIRPREKEGGRVILGRALAETYQITLRHNQNVFSLEFASLDFLEHARNKFAYKLEGFDKNWLTTDGKVRKATYTNLDAGEYTFKVKASDEDGVWNDKEATLKIIVLPPFWKTPWAYLLYLLAAVALLYFARRMIIRRARLRFALEQERREARRMHEMDIMKIRFFTNMSHELRTPLSLILAPVEKLIGQPLQADPKKQYELIRRNARRLLNLVNQLLDFRKMEVNELRLHTRQGDILKFIKDISLSFVDLADKKNIVFTYHGEEKRLVTLFDHDKLERILFNLLSNAFKFTPENGAVGVGVHTEKGDKGEVTLQIKIKDTGIGISMENQRKIFDRFFQTEIPDTILNQGSGIGLAISMEFVKMHQGSLSVESEINKGSCFTVTLPFREIGEMDAPVNGAAVTGIDREAAFADEETMMEEEQAVLPVEESGVGVADRLAAGGSGNGSAGGKRNVLLIVEDNEDFRFYLKDNLRASYIIHEASDGKEGWRKALALHPDLVVSDISMPLMNGIDLCKKIRSDERTRQIPIILLTALAEESIELKSLQTGANDYISKPFNFEILQSRIVSLLEYKATIKKTYQRQVEASPATAEITSADDVFLQNVLQQIEKNMSNADFSVEELSQQFHSSRSTFYKRLLVITGKTPVEFIRYIRLKRAAELLEKSQMTVSEIAYAVGFNNPKYFTQQFKLEFDIAPSAYRTGKKHNTDTREDSSR